MEVNDNLKSIMLQAGVNWNSKHKIFVAGIHKDLFLREEEVSKEEDLKAFCKLVHYLKSHSEYGVSTMWHKSKLNRYVFLSNKNKLEGMFPPHTLNALERYYKETDILKLYKRLGADNPNIIDLIGTTAVGKTTFCSQLVDDISKDYLELTIGTGNSTLIQTDILILEKTDRKLILSVRTKEEILTDFILVALKGDFKKLESIKQFKKSCGENIQLQLDEDVVQNVLDMFDREDLYNAFRRFVTNVKKCFDETDTNKVEFDYFKWAREASQQSELAVELDEIIRTEFLATTDMDLNNVYGYRHEFYLSGSKSNINNSEKIVLKTIAKKEFISRKEDLDNYPEMKNMVSLRIIFENAMFVFPPDIEARRHINFINGVVLRDSQGHKTKEQYSLASDFSVKSKIMLISVSTGGSLIDEEKRDFLQKIAISEPKDTVFIITKIDKTDEYSKFMDESQNELRFLSSLKTKIKDTHKNMLDSWKNRAPQTYIDIDSSEYELNDKQAFKFFIETFNNAFLTSLKSKKKLAYRINCDIAPDGSLIDKDDVKIKKLNSWYEILVGLINNSNVSSYANLDKNAIKKVNNNVHNILKSGLIENVNRIVQHYNSQEKWEVRVTEALNWFEEDFRTWRPEGEIWFYGSFRNERVISNITSVFKDPVSLMLNQLNKYTMKDGGYNAIDNLLTDKLSSELLKYYECTDSDLLRDISKRIVNRSLEAAIKIAYKVYDRKLYNQSWYEILKPIINDINSDDKYIVGNAPEWLKYQQRWYGYINTETGQRLAMYCHLLSVFKKNLETHFESNFTTVLADELTLLDSKVL
ncbi:hypothetical protein [Cohnella abietis]|uniref:Uncharacterized protein n=1 Tax=Cohnella abietis TaxID=2507935 RepID=A0A3T1CZ58_9BACL|nr:hypothetical protein [Cohnella abietis]BBI31147.1 hypothetical protein KCTCHS21_05460 [Cohnella abietis]